MTFPDIASYLSFVSDAMTIAASGIAVYLFIAKRKSISSAFRLLLNYSYHLTLTELKEKLEKLNDLNAKDPENIDDILNVFHEILGQVRGNSTLKSNFAPVTEAIEQFMTDKRRITEPRKRALVSEIRERLRHLHVESIDQITGKK